MHYHLSSDNNERFGHSSMITELHQFYEFGKVSQHNKNILSNDRWSYDKEKKTERNKRKCPG